LKVFEMSSLPESTSPASAGDAQSMVYVVDDDESMRCGLGNLLRSSGLNVETFATPREFMAFPRTAVPSCLILDVRLRGESGLAFQEEAVKSGLRIPVLFMTGYGDVAMAVKAMKAGALDFFTKPFREQDLLDAVTQALARSRDLLAVEHWIASLRACYDSLTSREQEVMKYVVAGLPNKRIAAAVNLSEVTVKIHRAQVMKKMRVRSVADLVRMTEALDIQPALD
jgi:FixJ family two-component response regulator